MFSSGVASICASIPKYLKIHNIFLPISCFLRIFFAWYIISNPIIFLSLLLWLQMEASSILTTLTAIKILTLLAYKNKIFCEAVLTLGVIMKNLALFFLFALFLQISNDISRLAQFEDWGQVPQSKNSTWGIFGLCLFSIVIGVWNYPQWSHFNAGITICTTQVKHCAKSPD